MSTSNTVYIGPYLRLEETPILERVDNCADHEREEGSRWSQLPNSAYKDAAFCAVCGRSTQRRYYTRRTNASAEFFNETHVDVLQRITAYWLERELEDDKTVSYAISNGGAQAPRLYLTEGECGVWSSESAALTDPKASVLIFEAQQRENIEALRALGVTVTVEWGVLSWTN